MIRALEVNPANRYQTAREFGQDLEHYMYDGGYGPTNEKLQRYLQRLFPTEANAPVATLHDSNVSPPPPGAGAPAAPARKAPMIGSSLAKWEA